MRIHAQKGMASWPHVMIVWGPGFATATHRHHCVQLLMTMRGLLRVRNGPEKRWRRCGAAWVRPDALHEMDARGGSLLIGFISAESELGVALCEHIARPIVCVPAREVARWRTELGQTPNETRIERWLMRFLLRGRRDVAIHPGVLRVLSYLQGSPSMLEDVSLKKLAGIATLSPSRFMHAFTESVGVPMRPYILWLRLQQAACDLANGISVTTAAHRAGFSDAAHLTRTFRRMLGATPSDLALLKRVTLGFSLDPTESRDRVVREISVVA
ncbi:MAG TPA: AraC family transcriptional regulator [Vicinamibacterales bacterium]|nr:AraC family transcriptional regulator [Vicinamibacterales bacterium]